MAQLFTQFGVDWQLLLAQVINFAILVFLLQRFAYKPVMNMLAERRRKIAEGLSASEESKRKLAEASEMQKQILLRAEEEALGVVNAAEDVAEKRGEEMIAAAEAKAEQVIVSGRKVTEEERLKMAEEFGQSAEGMLEKGLARVLGKMNPAERDKVLIAETLRELKISGKTSA